MLHFCNQPILFLLIYISITNVITGKDSRITMLLYVKNQLEKLLKFIDRSTYNVKYHTKTLN